MAQASSTMVAVCEADAAIFACCSVGSADEHAAKANMIDNRRRRQSRSLPASRAAITRPAGCRADIRVPGLWIWICRENGAHRGATADLTSGKDWDPPVARSVAHEGATPYCLTPKERPPAQKGVQVRGEVRHFGARPHGEEIRTTPLRVLFHGYLQSAGATSLRLIW